MFKGRLLLSLVAVLLMSAFAMADYVTIPVANYSFELPNAGKQNCWDGEKEGKVDVPGWSSDWIAGDSGVEAGWNADGSYRFGATDGEWAGYMMGVLKKRDPEPSTWQILPYVIQAGDEFMLSVDARANTVDSAFKMSLFALEPGGHRTELVSLEPTLGTTEMVPEGWATYRLTFAADDNPDSIGKKIGIELVNPNSGWMGIDNVIVPEPATIALLGLGGLALLRVRRKG